MNRQELAIVSNDSPFNSYIPDTPFYDASPVRLMMGAAGTHRPGVCLVFTFPAPSLPSYKNETWTDPYRDRENKTRYSRSSSNTKQAGKVLGGVDGINKLAKNKTEQAGREIQEIRKKE